MFAQPRGFRPQPRFERLDEAAAQRRRPEQDDHVARADAAAAGARIAGERAELAVQRHLCAGAKRLLVELVRGDAVLEVRLQRQREVQVSQPQGLQDPRVAHVFARLDRAQCPAERQSPRQQGLTLCDRLDREAMALEDRMSQARNAIAELDLRACGQAPRRDRDVVAGCRDAPDLLKSDRVHDASPLFSVFRLPELL